MPAIIRTNNVPRDILHGLDLTESERKEVDYYTENELDMACFFRYRGQIYDLSDFETCFLDNPEMEQWHGFLCDSFSSGLVVRYTPDYEQIIVGSYYIKSEI